jgi:hypothetical protein
VAALQHGGAALVSPAAPDGSPADRAGRGPWLLLGLLGLLSGGGGLAELLGGGAAVAGPPGGPPAGGPADGRLTGPAAPRQMRHQAAHIADGARQKQDFAFAVEQVDQVTEVKDADLRVHYAA